MTAVKDEFDDELVGAASLYNNNAPIVVRIARAKPKTKRKSYVKKVEHDWSHEETMQLIEAVEERRVLWDIRLSEFKLPKADAWKEVADAIGTSVDDVKGKWVNLRITFRHNLSKYRLKKSEQGTDELVVIHWRYFNMMMFLSDIYQSTESGSSLNSVLASANTDASTLKDSSVELPLPSIVVRSKRKRRAIRESTPTPSPSPSLSQSPSPTPIPIPISKPTSSYNSMKELVSNALSLVRVHDNKFSAFGDYIAAELRELPTDRAAFVQRALNRELLRLLEAEETLLHSIGKNGKHLKQLHNKKSL